MRALIYLVGILFLAILSGCTMASRHTDDGGSSEDDGDVDPWCTYSSFVQSESNEVDILFVVDNSNSMNEEQNVLAEQIVIMTQELIDPSDEGAPAVQDLHMGIVTTDMGSGGYQIQTCSNPMNGDYGVLQNTSWLSNCEGTYSANDCDRALCPWLDHSVAYHDDGTVPGDSPIWEDFGCVATLGTGGCGFEQQLESSLVALTIQSEPGMPNEGFVREDSLLAIIYVTDEDDCSTGNAEMFNPARNEQYGTSNVRCALNPDELYPISRYHDAFVALRGGNQDRVIVAAIVGVPVDGSWNPGDPIDYLADLQRVNPANPNELLKSCDTDMGDAFPPVRIAELVYSFGNNGILESICRSDWTSALSTITRLLQDKLTGACLNQAFPADALGECRVVETLTDDRPCPHPADVVGPARTMGWHVDHGLNALGLRECEILPADYDGDGCPDGSSICGDVFEGGLEGWVYRRLAPECSNGQVRLSSPDMTSPRSLIRIECLEGCS